MSIACVCFGRYQPITRGHALHFKQMIDVAVEIGADPFVFTSSTNNGKNPLDIETKVKFLNKLLVPLECSVGTSRDMFTAVEGLSDRYKEIVYFAGGDYFDPTSAEQNLFFRMQKHMETLGVKCRLRSTGDRSTGISGTDMREAAQNEDLTRFVSLSPVNQGDFTAQDAIDMYHSVVSGLKTHNK